MKIKHFDTIEDIKKCFSLMKELRGKLESEEVFVAQVVRQQKEKYRLLGIEVDEKIVALAGYRELENFIHGKYIYVDDLVTLPECRGQQFGEKILESITEIAIEKRKDQVVLDTALSNHRAQKFYNRVGLSGLGMHFCRLLKEKDL